MEKIKRCPKCGFKKSLTTEYWFRDKHNSGGFTAYCKECDNAASKKRHRQRKLVALSHYGGSPPSCQCCNESIIDFLVLDHVENNGSQHRKDNGYTSGNNTYDWVINNNFPNGFRVLCANCNQAFWHIGYCPHHPPL